MSDDNHGLDEFESPGAGGGDLAWRETYVVFFQADARPTLAQVEAAIGDAGGQRLRMTKLQADDDGLFRTILVEAVGDNAVIDIRYEAGAAVSERAMTLAEQMREDLDKEQVGRLVSADAWLEIMHFEKLAPVDFEGLGPDDDPMEPDADGPEGLDPATLITVVETLAHLTAGLPIDPEAGDVLI